MDVDDVVDLSMGRDSLSLTQETVRDLQALSQNSGLTITPAPPSVSNNGTLRISIWNCFHEFNWKFLIVMIFLLISEHYSRRVLRPRTEPKSYAEAPDIVLLPAKINGRQHNGNIDSESDDDEMPPIIAIKVKKNVYWIRTN